jgi:small subunit ribosomal protein S9
MTIKNKSQELNAAEQLNLSDFTLSTGKRKSSIAKVWLARKPANKKESIFIINNKAANEYLKRNSLYSNVLESINYLNLNLSEFNIVVDVIGGGVSSQSDAIKAGISKSFAELNEDYRLILRASTFLTRDTRRVESKKPGLRKARKKEQFSKR